MAKVARFVVVTESDNAITLPNPNTLINDIHLQDIQAPDVDTTAHGVIAFRAFPRGPVTLQVRLNSFLVLRETFLAGFIFFGRQVERSWHEIIPPGALKAADNELTVSVTGSGSVRVSDFVIHYQADVGSLGPIGAAE